MSSKFKCFNDISIQQVVLTSFSLASVFLILSNCHARSFFQREFLEHSPGQLFSEFKLFSLKIEDFLELRYGNRFPASRLSAQD